MSLVKPFAVATILWINFSFIHPNSSGGNLPLECPELSENETATKHFAYTTSYNHSTHVPNWVAYDLRSSELKKLVSREHAKFKPDPIIFPETCNSNDYKKSGYDRGHLAPAADMTFSEIAMNECFYMSNMAPQVHAFNAGIWKTLESQVRKWATEGNTLFITAGPIFTESLAKTPNIGLTHSVKIPQYFFKTVMDTVGKGRGIAFVFKHENSPLPLSHFAISIDSLEKLTHRNYFPNLSIKKQTRLEKSFHLEQWKF